jgi:hypothetical protein
VLESALDVIEACLKRLGYLGSEVVILLRLSPAKIGTGIPLGGPDLTEPCDDDLFKLMNDVLYHRTDLPDDVFLHTQSTPRLSSNS